MSVQVFALIGPPRNDNPDDLTFHADDISVFPTHQLAQSCLAEWQMYCIHVMNSPKNLTNITAEMIIDAQNIHHAATVFTQKWGQYGISRELQQCFGEHETFLCRNGAEVRPIQYPPKAHQDTKMKIASATNLVVEELTTELNSRGINTTDHPLSEVFANMEALSGQTNYNVNEWATIIRQEFENEHQYE